MQIGDDVKVISGTDKGDVGTIINISEDTVWVDFDGICHPQPYFKWQLSQNGVFPPREEAENTIPDDNPESSATTNQ